MFDYVNANAYRTANDGTQLASPFATSMSSAKSATCRRIALAGLLQPRYRVSGATTGF